MHACMHACMHAYIHTYIHAYIPTYSMHAYSRTNIYICLYTYIYIYTYIHAAAGVLVRMAADEDSSSEDSSDEEAEDSWALPSEGAAPVSSAAPPEPKEPPSEAARLRARLLSNRAARAATDPRLATGPATEAEKTRSPERDGDRKRRHREHRRKSKEKKRGRSRSRRRRRERSSGKDKPRARSERRARAASSKPAKKDGKVPPDQDTNYCALCRREVRGGEAGLDMHRRSAPHLAMQEWRNGCRPWKTCQEKAKKQAAAKWGERRQKKTPSPRRPLPVGRDPDPRDPPDGSEKGKVLTTLFQLAAQELRHW